MYERRIRRHVRRNPNNASCRNTTINGPHRLEQNDKQTEMEEAFREGVVEKPVIFRGDKEEDTSNT